MNVTLCCVIADPGVPLKISLKLYCLLLHIWPQTTQFLSSAELMNLYGAQNPQRNPVRFMVNIYFIVKRNKKHKWKVFSVEGSRYKRCDFEEGFCDLIQSSETLSGWFRTTEVPGLKHDHASNTSGEPLIFMGYIHFEFEFTSLIYISTHMHPHTSLSPL